MNEEKDISDELSITDNISIAVRSYSSLQHLLALIYFSELSHNYENTPLPTDNDDKQEIYINHRSSVMAGIIFSVLFLESNINEFYRDANDFPKDGWVKGLDETLIRRIANIDKTDTNRFSGNGILKKYSLALIICDKHIIDNVDVKILIRLRNFLSHNFPETVIRTEDETKYGNKYLSIKDALNRKYELNKLLPDNILFPDRMLSSGCVKWGFRSVIEFTDIFYERLGLDKPYEHYRTRFNFN